MGLFNNSNKDLKTFQDAVESRRSIYDLETEVSISDDEIKSIIEHTVKHVPSAFNSQSTRIVLLLNDKHEKFWDITKEELKKTMEPERDFQPTSDKIDNFKHSHGTVLFFEDQEVIKGLEAQMPAYADNFNVWANQTNGMHQFTLWTEFAIEGIGATIQHYNPLVDEQVAKTFDIPESWKLVAQMPFGNVRGEALEKEFKDVDERFIVRD
ncbi:nitroreductase family protein [Staphylococcus auricularis]|uniref:nitroreductase family protein n=1 Tax=Staphylococcus auricularis TaxID=29379 RepID=UPI003EBCF36B